MTAENIDSRKIEEPWDLILNQKNIEKVFSSIQKMGKRLFGFIICGWNCDGYIGWYWHDSNKWEEVDEERGAELPKIFKSLNGVKRRIAILQKFREILVHSDDINQLANIGSIEQGIEIIHI